MGSYGILGEDLPWPNQTMAEFRANQAVKRQQFLDQSVPADGLDLRQSWPVHRQHIIENGNTVHPAVHPNEVLAYVVALENRVSRLEQMLQTLLGRLEKAAERD